jgi:MinD superfamily P-loop ATPase
MIISIASGKGGTGKTLIATSLALSLQKNHRVQLLDCDVEEPNDYIFLKPVITHQETVSIPVPEVDKEKCNFCGKCSEVCVYKAIAVWGKQVMTFPQLCHGCGACSYICPSKAIKEQPREIGVIESGHYEEISFVQGKLNIGEAMSPPVIRKVKSYAVSQEITIIDSPPGTSCPVITAVKSSDFCLLVTEPTPFGLNDLTLAVETVKDLNIPCGVVINRNIDGEKIVEQYCQDEGIPILLTIPLETEIARLYSKGITLVKGLPQWEQSFITLYEKIREIVNERSSGIERKRRDG